MRRLTFVILLLAHTLFWISFSRHVPFGSTQLHFLDLDAYLALWRDIFSGSNPYTVSHMITLGPPLVLLPFLPFVFLPEITAHISFFLLNVMSGYLLCFQLSRVYFKGSVPAALFLGLVLFVTFPVRFSLLMGQPGLLVAFLLTLALTHPNARGIPLFFVVVLKTFFLVCFLTFVRKKRRALIKSIALVGLTIFAFSPLLPTQWYTYYATHTFAQVSLGSLRGNDLDYYNQSLKSTLHRLELDQFYFPLFIIFALSLGLYIIHSSDLPVAIVTSLLLSPIVWQHYMVFLFPVFVVAFSRSQRAWKPHLIIAFILCSIMIPGIQEAPHAIWTALFSSHMFVGLMLLLAVLLFGKKAPLPSTRMLLYN